MEPEDNRNKTSQKTSQNQITRQINRYRNTLPQIPRDQNHFFFKQVTRQMEGVSYVTIGYRVGRVPFQLHDLLAVVINCIHYSCELNLKIILDGDQLWVTSSLAVSQQEMNSLQYRVEEANLNESLLKTQKIIAQFLQQMRTQPRQDDAIVLERVKNVIVKNIYTVFKNPDLQD